MFVELAPIETPDYPVTGDILTQRGKVGGNQRRVSPIKQPRGDAMMLRRNEQLPDACLAGGQVGLSVTDEIPEYMFFEIGLGMGTFASAESIEGCQQAGARIAGAAVNSVITSAPAGRIRFSRGTLIDQFTQAGNSDFTKILHCRESTSFEESHPQWSSYPPSEN